MTVVGSSQPELPEFFYQFQQRVYITAQGL